MLTLLQPSKRELPFQLWFNLDCFCFDQLVEDLEELVQQPGVKRISISYSPLNGFSGSVLTNYDLTPDFIEKYNIKKLQK